MEECAIEFRDVSKIYKLIGKDKKKSEDKKFYALKQINFKISKGEVVGILGTNGSGKSTMATILAGISEIDEGEMIVNGEQALIAINTGLNNQLTGLENIELKGALLGLKPHRVKEIIDGVADFSELGEFLYQPVKKYSSGMKSRLGFSINLCLDPDILIVDEALSVGDKGFANKCLKRMKELKTEGKTIVFISHSLPQVREFCDTALWIEGGMVREYGKVDPVSDHYSKYVDYLNSLNAQQKKEENEKKFQQRLIVDEKDGFWDKLLTFFQKNL
jgi:teichoic acid transport system ATP-binding protein